MDGFESGELFGGDFDEAVADADGGVLVGAGPEFGSSIVGGCGDEGEVDDNAVGWRGVLHVWPEVSDVGVDGLSFFCGISVLDGEGGVSAVEGVFESVAEDGVGDLDGGAVEEDVGEEIGVEGRWVLLDVAFGPVVGGVGSVLEGFEVLEHPVAEDLDVFEVDGVLEDDEAILFHGLACFLEVLRGDGLLYALLVCELDAGDGLVGADVVVAHGWRLSGFWGSDEPVQQIWAEFFRGWAGSTHHARRIWWRNIFH